MSFHQITPCCGARVRLTTNCQNCGHDAPRAGLKKGYEIAKGQYVVLTKEEIQSVRLPSAKTIVIEGFIASDKLDPLLLADTFYTEPDEKGETAYSLFAEALGLLGKVAVGRVVSNGRETPVAIRRWGNLLLLSLLWYPSEIRKPPEVQLREATERERGLARQLIEACDGVDFTKFKDRYVEALQELIRAKAEGREVAPIAEVVPTEIGIAEALEASLKEVKVQA